jgi:two-component system cell cycle response regulator
MVAICLENCLALEQLQRQGQEDILTQVRNRRSFDEEFGKELERAAREQKSLSCLFADIDYFKQINDAYGHQVGDRCLRQVAQQIARELRKTDLLARYGGEEFVVLLPGCPAHLAVSTAERIRLAVANRPLRLPNETIPLTISLGLVTWQPDTTRTELESIGSALLDCADLAMYQAKREGRNRVCVGDFSAVQVSE